jgi:hypothetical protein
MDVRLMILIVHRCELRRAFHMTRLENISDQIECEDLISFIKVICGNLVSWI